MFIIAGMAAVVLTGCQRQDEVTETPATESSYVHADLALSLPPSSSSTRLVEDVTSGGDATDFRGISSLSIIPFTKQGKIVKSDKPSIIEISGVVPDFKKIDNDYNKELYRYYEKVFLNRGVASFLTYGQGNKTTPAKPENVDSKVFYGSLIPKVAGEEITYIPDRLNVTAGDLSFELETIYNETKTDETTGKTKPKVPEEAQAIADYLTYIANSKVTVGGDEYSWKSKQINETLKGFYSSFISSLESGKYGVIAGSSENVKAYVNQLYTKLQNTDFGADEIAGKIRAEIQSRILNKNQDFTQFTIVVEDNKVKSALDRVP